jgi:hypothetical protein
MMLHQLVQGVLYDVVALFRRVRRGSSSLGSGAPGPQGLHMDVWLIANDAGLDSYYVASSFPAFQLQVNTACSYAAGAPAGPSRGASVVTEKPTTYTWLAQEAADPTHRAPRPPRRLRGRALHPAVDAQPTHHAAPRLPSLELLSERAPAFPHAVDIIYRRLAKEERPALRLRCVHRQ